MENSIDIDLLFQQPNTNHELVKYIGNVEGKEVLQPLKHIILPSESDTSDDGQLPEELLNEPLDDDVFEDENTKVEDVNVDLVFCHPNDVYIDLNHTVQLFGEILEDEDHTPTREIPGGRSKSEEPSQFDCASITVEHYDDDKKGDNESQQSFDESDASSGFFIAHATEARHLSITPVKEMGSRKSSKTQPVNSEDLKAALEEVENPVEVREVFSADAHVPAGTIPSEGVAVIQKVESDEPGVDRFMKMTIIPKVAEEETIIMTLETETTEDVDAQEILNNQKTAEEDEEKKEKEETVELVFKPIDVKEMDVEKKFETDQVELVIDNNTGDVVEHTVEVHDSNAQNPEESEDAGEPEEHVELEFKQPTESEVQIMKMTIIPSESDVEHTVEEQEPEVQNVDELPTEQQIMKMTIIPTELEESSETHNHDASDQAENIELVFNQPSQDEKLEIMKMTIIPAETEDADHTVEMKDSEEVEQIPETSEDQHVDVIDSSDTDLVFKQPSAEELEVMKMTFLPAESDEVEHTIPVSEEVESMPEASEDPEVQMESVDKTGSEPVEEVLEAAMTNDEHIDLVFKQASETDHADHTVDEQAPGDVEKDLEEAASDDKPEEVMKMAFLPVEETSMQTSFYDNLTSDTAVEDSETTDVMDIPSVEEEIIDLVFRQPHDDQDVVKEFMNIRVVAVESDVPEQIEYLDADEEEQKEMSPQKEEEEVYVMKMKLLHDEPETDMNTDIDLEFKRLDVEVQTIERTPVPEEGEMVESVVNEADILNQEATLLEPGNDEDNYNDNSEDEEPIMMINTIPSQFVPAVEESNVEHHVELVFKQPSEAEEQEITNTPPADADEVEHTVEESETVEHESDDGVKEEDVSLVFNQASEAEELEVVKIEKLPEESEEVEKTVKVEEPKIEQATESTVNEVIDTSVDAVEAGPELEEPEVVKAANLPEESEDMEQTLKVENASAVEEETSEVPEVTIAEDKQQETSEEAGPESETFPVPEESPEHSESLTRERDIDLVFKQPFESEELEVVKVENLPEESVDVEQTVKVEDVAVEPTLETLQVTETCVEDVAAVPESEVFAVPDKLPRDSDDVNKEENKLKLEETEDTMTEVFAESVEGVSELDVLAVSQEAFQNSANLNKEEDINLVFNKPSESEALEIMKMTILPAELDEVKRTEQEAEEPEVFEDAVESGEEKTADPDANHEEAVDLYFTQPSEKLEVMKMTILPEEVNHAVDESEVEEEALKMTIDPSEETPTSNQETVDLVFNQADDEHPDIVKEFDEAPIVSVETVVVDSKMEEIDDVEVMKLSREDTITETENTVIENEKEHEENEEVELQFKPIDVKDLEMLENVWEMNIASCESDIEQQVIEVDIESEAVPRDPSPPKMTKNVSFGNDYLPFGTEDVPDDCVLCDFIESDIDFQQWKDEDVISLQSLKSLVAEVGLSTDKDDKPEETLKILKVVPSEPCLADMDYEAENCKVIPILQEKSEKYLDNMVENIIDEAARLASEDDEILKSIVTESELAEMKEKEDDEEEDEREKTPIVEVAPPPKTKVRFGPLNLKLGLEPLEVITSPQGLSPLSPSTLAEYEHIPVMEIHSVTHSPQEKEEVIETKILTTSDDETSEGLDSIGDLSERTIQRFNTSFDDPTTRRDSFSSISSFGDRLQFRTAIENIRQDLLPFQSSVSQYLEPPQADQLVINLSMDSPSDLSPNAPPTGFENPAQYFGQLQQNAEGDHPSAEGSIDSSGFEKVEHEGLDDFSPVADPMQKSVFGALSDEKKMAASKKYDNGFELIDKKEIKEKMSHDDVIEKNYFGEEQANTAKLLESPIAEEARKLVQDAVESASDYAKASKGDAEDEIVIPPSGFEQVKEKASEIKDSLYGLVEDPSPVTDMLHRAQDGLSGFVHETVPHAYEDAKHAVSDFVEEHKPKSPEPQKTVVDDLLDIRDDVVEAAKPDDIADSVDHIHDEVDSFLRGAHRSPSPPQEVDEERYANDAPHFGNQTPEEDETTFERNGPLTIPDIPESQVEDDFADFDPLVASATGAAFGGAVAAAASQDDEDLNEQIHRKFEKVPRPPTPPKDISDEDVKPSSVNLGPAPHHSHPNSPHHSILKHHDAEPWCDFKSVDPKVLDLIYWRDPKKSGIALAATLFALFVLARYPLLSVIAYTGLAVLAGTVGFRLFKTVEAQIKKTGGENPFQEILAQDVNLPQEKVHAQVDVLVEHGQCLVNRAKKLIFVESVLDSVKFGLVLWTLTYIASWLSGCTLVFLTVVGIFSIPKLYETYQEPIDAHLAVICGHLQNVQNLLEEKIPFLRRPVAEEKKEQ